MRLATRSLLLLSLITLTGATVAPANAAVLQSPPSGHVVEINTPVYFHWLATAESELFEIGTSPNLDLDPTRHPLNTWGESGVRFETPGVRYWRVCDGDPITSCTDAWALVVVAPPECRDGTDNDGDSQIDEGDWGCDYQDDPSEHLERAPMLSKSEAVRTIKAVARRKFKNYYRNGEGKRFRCRRASRTRFKCNGSWFLGDGSLKMKSTILQGRQGEDVWIGHRSSATHTDWYCVASNMRNCRKHYRWKG